MGTGKNIRLVRTDRGMLQLDLAEALEISNTKLSRIELEKEVPTREIVEECSRLLDVPYEDLAYGVFVVRLQTADEESAALDEGETTS